MGNSNEYRADPLKYNIIIQIEIGMKMVNYSSLNLLVKIDMIVLVFLFVINYHFTMAKK